MDSPPSDHSRKCSFSFSGLKPKFQHLEEKIIEKETLITPLMNKLLLQTMLDVFGRHNPPLDCMTSGYSVKKSFKMFKSAAKGTAGCVRRAAGATTSSRTHQQPSCLQSRVSSRGRETTTSESKPNQIISYIITSPRHRGTNFL